MNHIPLLSFMKGSAKTEAFYEQNVFRIGYLSSPFCLEVKIIFSRHILYTLYLCERSTKSTTSCSRVLCLGSVTLGRGQPKQKLHLEIEYLPLQDKLVRNCYQVGIRLKLEKQRNSEIMIEQLKEKIVMAGACLLF